MAIDPQRLAAITNAFAVLDQLMYYQILNIDPAAPGKEVKRAFLRRSQEFHPDLFFNEKDETVKTQVTTIYKRVAEAYQVLRNVDHRAGYDKQLKEEPDNKRFQHKDKKPAGQVEATTKNSQAKKFLQLALNCLKKKDYSGAEMNLQFALKFDSSNETLKKKLEEAREQKELADADKDPYKIQ